MKDSVFTIDDNNNTAINTVTAPGIEEENKKDVFTVDKNGNAAIRVVGGTGSIDVDTALSTTSTNPVQNKVITEKINEIESEMGGIKAPNVQIHSNLDYYDHLVITADGAVSKFSPDEYIVFPINWNFVNQIPNEEKTVYEFEIGIKTAAVYQQDEILVYSKDNMLVMLRQDAYLEFAVNPFSSYDDSSFNQYNNGVLGIEPIEFQANKDYKIKVTFACDGYSDDEQDYVWSYRLYASEDDGQTYKLQVIHSMIGAANLILPVENPLYFGVDPTADADNEHPFGGKIYLGKNQLIVNNNVVWEGMASDGLVLKSSLDLNNLSKTGKNQLCPVYPNVKSDGLDNTLTESSTGIYTGFGPYDFLQYKGDPNDWGYYNNWELHLGFETGEIGEETVIYSQYGLSLSFVDGFDGYYYLRLRLGDGEQWVSIVNASSTPIKPQSQYEVRIAYNRLGSGEYVVYLSQDYGRSWIEEIFDDSFGTMFTATHPLYFGSCNDEMEPYFTGSINLGQCDLTTNWRYANNSTKSWTKELIWTGMCGVNGKDFPNLSLNNVNAEGLAKLLPDTEGRPAGLVLKTDGADGCSWESQSTATATTATLVVADWSSSTQTVTVSGVTANNVVIVAPAPASQADWVANGVVCSAQGVNQLTFTCTTTPSNTINVNVVIF